MELRDYVRVKRRWLVPLVLVPALVAAVTGLLSARQAPMSTAQIQIQVPSTEAADSQIGLYVAKLDQAFQVRSVRSEIAAQAGIDAATLGQGLTVNRIGNSNQIALVLSSPDGNERTLQAARTAALAGTVYVATQPGTYLEQALEAARQTLTEAQDALRAFQDEVGIVDANATYQQNAASLRAAVAELATSEALGDSTRAARAQAQIAALERQRVELLPLLQDAAQLQAAVTSATDQVNNARRQLTNYNAQVALARSGEQIIQSTVAQEPRRRAILEAAGLAAVIAFLAMLGISLLPDLLQRQRRGRGAHRTGPLAATASGAEESRDRIREETEDGAGLVSAGTGPGVGVTAHRSP